VVIHDYCFTGDFVFQNLLNLDNTRVVRGVH
jgi:hypothetical protein